ncbi:hypothetical protein CBS101457_005601 [Exobasidium rhododendri]|nr:hypothetical protein CBS101457_005601 [Exobasidium rhododendri]
MPLPTGWHPGEIAAQQARGYEDDVWGMWQNYEDGAPSFMTSFLSSLPFLSVTTLDEEEMPWASLLCNDGDTDFLQIVASDDYRSSRLKCTIKAPVGVPIRACLLKLQEELTRGVRPYREKGIARRAFQLAAVGVMLQNRRRNKMECVIVSIDQAPQSDNDVAFVFHMDVVSTFGNCPKYINARYLIPASESSFSQTTTTHGKGDQLSPEVLSIISRADLLFLASRHSGDLEAYPADPARLGNNIRGGPPGFLRTFWDDEAQSICIVLPDWSGNRLMQSLGNITGDPVAGITIPVWSDSSSRFSDLLHLSCSAQVLANEEASNLIRGVKGAVKLWPHKWTLVRHGLPIFAAVVESPATARDPQPVHEIAVGWSPYNPPIRLLNSEQSSLTLASSIVKRPVASLIDAQFYTPKIATLTFLSDQPLPYLPGQHIILDCYNLLDTRVQLYSHMANFRGGEKDLNDDGTRSWTISHAQVGEDGTMQQFQLTLRRKDRGGVTPNLFHQAKMLREELDEGEIPPTARTQIEVLGVDGSSMVPPISHGETTIRLAFFLSGIGMTPLLPSLSCMKERSGGKGEVLAVIAVKWTEVGVFKQVIRQAFQHGEQKKGTTRLHIQAFLLAGARPAGEEGDSEIGSSQEDLPGNVILHFHILIGRRLTPESLTSQENGGSGFVLPQKHREALMQAEEVVVCGGPAFARTAQEALHSANIPNDKIKVESFAF